MADITIWYHDPAEVAPESSWTGIAPTLKSAIRRDITTCNEPEVLKLFEYARPDAVVTVDSKPVVSIEQTMMNPSGHNIPQRFSCIMKAAEHGVPGILYYPEASRRTLSDPNLRYLNIRVPLAQFRLMEVLGSLSLSLFWPTGPNKLPRTDQQAQSNLAEVVELLVKRVEGRLSLQDLAKEDPIAQALGEMDRVIRTYGVSRGYRPNPTVRALKPTGFEHTQRTGALPIDPPLVVELSRTDRMLSGVFGRTSPALKDEFLEAIQARQNTLTLRATANHSHKDSEHPWPGYLTLLDMLYAREGGGLSALERSHNLVYRLPIPIDTFVKHLGSLPTPTRIVYSVADLVILDGGVVLGRLHRRCSKQPQIWRV